MPHLFLWTIVLVYKCNEALLQFTRSSTVSLRTNQSVTLGKFIEKYLRPFYFEVKVRNICWYMANIYIYILSITYNIMTVRFWLNVFQTLNEALAVNCCGHIDCVQSCTFWSICTRRSWSSMDRKTGLSYKSQVELFMG